MTLTEFLLARLAEDEAEAGSTFLVWDFSEEDGYSLKARVLADVAAKRAIVELHDPGQHSELCATCSEGGPGYDNSPLWFPCPTIRILATIYADHPDFDESWRP